jgi:zinc transporter ZupT
VCFSHFLIIGLATFVAALQDPKVGAVLAIAIAIHNVPEGKEKRFHGLIYL